MKSYLFLSVIPFLSLLSPAWGSDEGTTPLAALDKPDLPKVSEQTTIEEMLSQKFYYFGEELNREIQKIKEKTFKRPLVESLPSLAYKKRKESNDGSEIEQKEDRVDVTVFVKKEHELKKHEEGFKRALLAAAYFPEQLEPRPEPLTISSNFARYKFVHRQLADALFYDHPLAKKYLKQVASLCKIPLSDSRFYKDVYSGADEDMSQYTSYLIRFNLSHSIKEKLNAEEVEGEEEGITQKIDLPFYSKEVGDYFQGLIDQNPESENRKS